MKTTETSVSDVLEDKEYKYGFKTLIETETFAKGLNEDVVRKKMSRNSCWISGSRPIKNG